MIKWANGQSITELSTLTDVSPEASYLIFIEAEIMWWPRDWSPNLSDGVWGYVCLILYHCSCDNT